MGKSPYRWIWSYIRKHVVTIVIALAVCAVVAGLSLVSPYITGRIVDEVFQQGNFDALYNLLLLMVAVTLVRMILRYAFVFTFERTSQAILFDLRRDIYRRVQVQSYSFFDGNRVGDIMSRMTGDLDAIRHFLSAVIYMVFENILIFFTAIVLIFLISWQMALLFLAFAPVIGICAFLQSKEIKPRFSSIREQFSRLNTVCQENISGNRVVKAFTREDFETEKFDAENQAFYQKNIDASYAWAKYLPIIEICAGLLGFILLLGGGILVILDKMELWQLVTVNGYLWAVYNPMRLFGWLVNDTQRFVASLEKVFDMMSKKIYITNPEDSVSPEKLSGGVEFKNVTFNYDRHNNIEPALKNISFKLEPGKTLGIVGATGSGKTTLINLIGRYYDVTEGEVAVDGIDVRKFDLHTLRSHVAIANQDVFLFSDTVEGNIVYGVPDAPMETVYSVAQTADADGFIREMENGYDTIIGERGVGLSGGQKQRLSLARAIAVKPSILILDDTTSAVDMETEHSIQTALKEMKKNNPGMSIIIIAHRISSVKSADLILALDKGEIIERGKHDELLALNGYYNSLFMNQYGEFDTVSGQRLPLFPPPPTQTVTEKAAMINRKQYDANNDSSGGCLNGEE